MIAVDTNLLVHAHRRDSEFHDRAAQAVRSLAEAAATWSIPWPCVHEFYGIVTHQRIFDPPSSIAAAAGQVDAWLESPSLTLIGEGHRHWQMLRELVSDGKVTGPRVHDARIAAICRAHRVTELWSADRDFSRFPQLKVRNPLV